MNDWVDNTNSSKKIGIWFNDLIIYEENIEHLTDFFEEKNADEKLDFLTGYF